MKMVSNRVNTSITTPTETSLIEVLDLNIYLASTLYDLHKVLLTREEALVKDQDPDQISAMQMVCLEELDGFSGTVAMSSMAMVRPFMMDSYNDRFQIAEANLAPILDQIETLTLAGVALSDTTVENLREAIRSTLSNLVYVIYYGYEFNQIKDKAERGEEFEVQAFMVKYFEAKSLDVVEIAQFFGDLSKEFKPVLEVFEKAPELEEEFHLKAGIYVEVFLSKEEYLTLDVVSQVITEEKPIETIVSEFEEAVSKAEKAKRV